MTNPKMTRKLAAALLVLSRHSDGLSMKGLGDSFVKWDREALRGAGLIEVDDSVRPMVIHLSDRGWRWLSEDLADVVDPARGPLVQRGFDVFVVAVSAYLRRQGIPFADLATTPRAAPLEEKPIAAGPIRGSESLASSDLHSASARLRAAYFEETGGRHNVNVVIAALRRRLPDLSRDEVDVALRAFQVEGGKFGMVDMENSAMVTADMADGACDFKGRIMHFVRIAS